MLTLPPSIPSLQLYSLFGKYGAIRQIRVGNSKETRGTAYVVYEASCCMCCAVLLLPPWARACLRSWLSIRCSLAAATRMACCGGHGAALLAM